MDADKEDLRSERSLIQTSEELLEMLMDVLLCMLIG